MYIYTITYVSVYMYINTCMYICICIYIKNDSPVCATSSRKRFSYFMRNTTAAALNCHRKPFNGKFGESG